MCVCFLTLTFFFFFFFLFMCNVKEKLFHSIKIDSDETKFHNDDTNPEAKRKNININQQYSLYVTEHMRVVVKRVAKAMKNTTG